MCIHPCIHAIFHIFYTVDMVYRVDMVYTVDTVYTVGMVYTVAKKLADIQYNMLSEDVDDMNGCG